MFSNERNHSEAGSTDAPHMSLDEVREYIASRFAEQMSIQSLAQLAGLSPNYFGEAFKKRTDRA